MNSDAFKDIEKLESDLWEAADNLRANPKLTSSDYFMPVLGVIFLRHAANRFDAAHRQIEADRASGKMPKRKVLPADYIARRSLPLPEKARYDWVIHQAEGEGGGLATRPIPNMNLAVQGLEGKTAQAITYYQDEHTRDGKLVEEKVTDPRPQDRG